MQVGKMTQSLWHKTIQTAPPPSVTCTPLGARNLNKYEFSNSLNKDYFLPYLTGSMLSIGTLMISRPELSRQLQLLSPESSGGMLLPEYPL